MAETRPSLIEDSRRISTEVRSGWSAQPDKLLFGVLMLAWVALFHFAGNSTFGFVGNTPSLFRWAYATFNGSPDDNYCLYVPLVVLGLLIWKRQELIAAPKRNWWPGMAIVGFGLFIHVVGFLGQQARISIVGFFLGLYGLTGWVWGPAWLKATVFPMFLLGFAVPIGLIADTLTLPLRMFVTKVSVGFGHHVLGIGVFRQGSVILDANNVALYDVAPACSGIRSLISLIALATVFAFVSYNSRWRRAVLIGAALPLAMLGNIVRITTVIIVGEAFGQPAGAMIEQNFGFLTFGAAMLGLFLIANWLREDKAPPAIASAQRPNPA